MRTLKLLFSGGLLILLGPTMHCLDVSFGGFHVLCWVMGIPLFVLGLIRPEGGWKVPPQAEELPQKKCPDCGKFHDFDFPKCPHCGYDYFA